MTQQENLRKTLRGETPAWIPFAPNFWQWFTHHQAMKTLPAELRDCKDYIDAMKVLGCDIFSRNISSGFRECNRKLTPQVTLSEEPIGQRKIVEYNTPYGTLRIIDQHQRALTTSHQEEYFVKDWAKDGDACNYLLDQLEYEWDEETCMNVIDKIGDDGIYNMPLAWSPLKMLHNLCGLEYTCYLVMDYPDVAKKLCDDYWQKLQPIFERVAKHPRVESVILMDNVDTPFYPPALLEEYWTPYLKKVTTLLHQHGKYLFVHGCGKLAKLAPQFVEAQITGIEGVAHPYLGDWCVREAQACHSRYIFMGGFSAQEQEEPDENIVRAFYRDYLATARKERFIFSSSCQTSIGTPWERIKLVRDICREWGGSPV
jgi:hypothetical protein